jgi:hypothetical protein
MYQIRKCCVKAFLYAVKSVVVIVLNWNGTGKEPGLKNSSFCKSSDPASCASAYGHFAQAKIRVRTLLLIDYHKPTSTLTSFPGLLIVQACAHQVAAQIQIELHIVLYFVCHNEESKLSEEDVTI